MEKMQQILPFVTKDTPLITIESNQPWRKRSYDPAFPPIS